MRGTAVGGDVRRKSYGAAAGRDAAQDRGADARFKNRGVDLGAVGADRKSAGIFSLEHNGRGRRGKVCWIKYLNGVDGGAGHDGALGRAGKGDVAGFVQGLDRRGDAAGNDVDDTDA